MRPDLLEVSGLAVSYGDSQAVRDVSLRVGAGAITAMVGANGAGKTTTLHAIAGLLPRRSGTIVLGGRDIARASAAARPGLGLTLVQQGKRIFPHLTVEQNLLVATWPRGAKRRERSEMVGEAYDRFPVLLRKRYEFAGELSGGQQQMLAIGQALMARPKVLMLDEPSAGLAPVVVKQVFENLVALAEDGLGILLVEQLVEDSLAIARQVVVLEEGAVVMSGDVATIARDPRLVDAYLGHQL